MVMLKLNSVTVQSLLLILIKKCLSAEEKAFKEFLEAIGDSIVLVADDEIVKVHVHTNEPGVAITKALTYGSLSRMKIDNMREEHQERLIKKQKRWLNSRKLTNQERNMVL